MPIQKILGWLTPIGLTRHYKEKKVFITKKRENISMPHPRGTTITLFTYRVSSKSKMTLTHFSNYLNLPGHWHHVTWSIQRNGIGVDPYDAISDQMGLTTEPGLITPLDLRGGDELRIIATDDNSIAQPPDLATGIAIRYEVI